MKPTSRKPPLRLMAATLSAILSGCAVGPAYQAPTAKELLPQHFATSSAGAKDTAGLTKAWWQLFQDSALDELVKAASQHSPDLETADANIRQARANVTQITGQRLPQLNADGRIGRDQLSRNSEAFSNIPLPSPRTGFDDYKFGFDASWELDIFGHTQRSIESAKARLGGVEQQRADAALRVSAETARNVLDHRYWQLRIANATAVLDNQRELLRLTILQQQAGAASLSDVRLAEANVHNAEGVLPSLQAAAQASIAALGPLTAMPAKQIAETLAKSNLRPSLPESLTAELSSELLRRRPDLRIAERQLAAATADVGVAVANQYPRFTLVGLAGWDSIRTGMLTDQASRYWNIGPQLSLPLFSGGQIRAQIAANEAVRDAALANYRKAVLNAFADVETATARCQGDRERLAKLLAARVSLDQQLEYSRQRYQVGDTPRTDLIGAELQVANTNDQQLTAEQALAEDLVTLIKAIGGG